MAEVEQFKRIVNYDNMNPAELETLKKKLLLRQKTFQLKNLAQQNFLKFVKQVWPEFVEGPHHIKIAEKFQALAEGKIKRLIVNMPPRHTKSEFASFLFPAWMMGREPRLKIIQTTHTAELSYRFGRKVRNLMEENTFQDIFDDIQLESQPDVYRRPEIIHGIRNLVQNAVDFAKSTVWIRVEWGNDTILLKISDDGFGFAPEMIGRLGDPFINKKLYKNTNRNAQKYEGMGLGLFIAKTLLERTGATLLFSNSNAITKEIQEGEIKKGAIVEVCWPKNLLQVSDYNSRSPLPKNVKN